MDDDVVCINKPDIFTCIIKSSCVLAGDIYACAVFGFEALDVMDNNNIFIRVELQGAECETDTIVETDLIQVNCASADVDEFYEFCIGVVYINRMIHNLGDAKVVFYRFGGIDGFIEGTPLAAIESPCLDMSGLV
ncbi:hypothetical protein ES703_83738 [subsurface metagenome]